MSLKKQVQKSVSVLVLGFTCAIALAISAGYAQDTPTQDGPAEEVVVSASRISISGYEAPTPVTVVDSATIQRAAHVDIGDTIRELPSVGRSDSPNNGSHSADASQGDAGISTVNLRDLGVLRTLILFDGQRVVTSNPQSGGVDLSTIPATLVQRIDVVTGGASASWGSDAVAGVVNLVLDKTFEGLKGSVNFGDSYKDDHRTYKGELTWGMGFDGDRGHLILSGAYTMSPDTVFLSQRGWFNPQTLFPGPAGGPTYVHTFINGSARFTQGGLITASAAGAGQVGVNGVTALAPANALAGIQFVGNAGTPAPFNFGTMFGGNCANCSADKFGNTQQYGFIAVPYHNTTLFGYSSYKIAPWLQASIQLNYGQNSEENTASDRTSSVTVKPDNAYLDPSIAAQMIAGGIPNITVGTNNLGNVSQFDSANPTFASMSTGLGQVVVRNDRQLMRGVFTLQGELGSDWSWNAYAQHSQIREREHVYTNTINQNYNNAVDAVRVTATGPDSVTPAARAALIAAGAPVPAVGSIACRSSLTSTSWGVSQTAAGTTMASGGLTPTCVPLNIFGTGNYSQAAINYLAPGRNNPAIADEGLWLMSQDVFSASAQGVLPWGLAAGKVAVAAGGEYRHELQRASLDPLQIGAIPGWAAGNFTQYGGQYNVEEGFLEANAPILKDNVVQSLDFSAAGRITSYSTSGLVQTWKLGLTSQINNDFRLRTTWSEDIRAPIVTELFAPAQYQYQQDFDPHNANKAVNAYNITSGNSALGPEKANTISAGIVVTPHWLDGVNFSVDYYSIVIKDAIYTTGTTQITQQCVAGNKIYCASMFYGTLAPGASGGSTAILETDGNGNVANVRNVPADYNGALNNIISQPLNAASETTSGFDFQADYTTGLYSGTLNLHFLGNYTDQRTRTALGSTYDAAGAVGGDAPYAGEPKFHATLAATYITGPWENTVQVRYIGTSRLNNYWTSGVQVDNNAVPEIAYVDLRTGYQWSDNISLYGAIDNLFNTPPPNVASTTGGSTTNLTIWDGLGRAFRVGVRFSAD